MILSFSGRTLFAATFSGAPTLTETLINLVANRDGIPAAASNSISVTQGKTLRITQVSLTIQNSAAVAAGALVRLRMNPTGAVTLTSPLIVSVGASALNAVINGFGQNDLDVVEGLEISGTMQIGATLMGVATGTAHLAILGFEY
jgi:hypothetical protein